MHGATLLERARGVVVARDPSKVVAPVRARSGAFLSDGLATFSIVKTRERELARRLRREGAAIMSSKGWVTQAVFAAIQEIGGFTRVAWLE
jgi:hypothetical protein